MTGNPRSQYRSSTGRRRTPTDPPVNIEIQATILKALPKWPATFTLHGYQPGWRHRKPADGCWSEQSGNNHQCRQGESDDGRAQYRADGMEIRTALFCKEVSKLKDGEDEYKIQLRTSALVRNNIIDLMNMRITLVDMNTMREKHSIGTVATIDYTTANGAVKTKKCKRTIQLQKQCARLLQWLVK